MRDIVIKDFQKGISESPEVGFGDMRNLDISKVPGVARINFNAVESTYSGTAILNLVQWFATNPNDPSMIFALDAGQKLYKSTDYGGTWTMITGNNGGFGGGLAFWKDYLFVFRPSTIDVLGPPYGTANWTLSWDGTDIGSDSSWHPAIVGQDDILYFGCGRYVGTVQEVPGSTFNPASSTTYIIQYGTSSSNALDLPEDYRIKCIAELGKDLLFGTWKGSNIYDFPVADIFPWDRTSDSFGIPIRLAEVGVHQLLNVENIVYISAGINGRYYATNGATVTEVFRIPESIMNVGSGYITPRPGAIMQYQDKVLFGTGASQGIGGQGVWGFQRGALTLENIISTGNDGSGATGVNIGALVRVQGNSYLIGWSDGTDYGIDKVSTTRYTGYLAYFESPYIPIGTKTEPVPLSEIEFILAKPLATGQGIRIKYRTNLNDSFTTLGTYDFATYGAITNYIDSFGVTADGGIQIRGELTTGSGATTTPELREIRIR